MSPPTTSRFGTKTIHAGQDPAKWGSNEVIPPISLSTTFKQPHPGVYKTYDYSRCGNPTRDVLQELLATLEGGKYCSTFGSGLASVMSTINYLKTGDHIICADNVYGVLNEGTSIKIGFVLSWIDSIPYTIYQYLSFFAIFLGIITIIFAMIRKSQQLEHPTERILFVTFLLTNFIKSIISSLLTTNNLDSKLNLLNIGRSYFNCAIMVICVYLKFVVFLIIVDLILKAKIGQNYGKGLLYCLICVLLLITMLALSCYLGSLIFVLKGNAFILYFKLVITSVQFLSTFASIYLYWFVRYLRKQSITSSSLSLRHESGRNILLLKGHFPMVTIDSIIGTFSVTLSLLGTYVFEFPTNVSFSNYFLYFEISSILIYIHLIWSWQKAGRITIFQRCLTKKENNTSRTTVVKTLTTRVPIAQTHDAYFKSLQKSWK